MTEIDFRNIAEADHVPIIRRDTEEYLRRFISKNKIKHVLEYGTAIGYSAYFFSEICKCKAVFSVEKDEYAFEIAKRNLGMLDSLERIHLIKGDALRVTKMIIEESNAAFDLIFIDGGKSHYLELIQEAMKLCKVGGYILSDDIWQRGLTKMDPNAVARKHRTSMRNMQEYLEYICNTSELETEIFDVGDGLAESKYIGRNG
ncbi:MAG: class I SAM-dependent methyltransferase [Firmicutes bacterium]|nr:class I SAM-dependent methyltransferase [Bacillota bacterium]